MPSPRCAIPEGMEGESFVVENGNWAGESNASLYPTIDEEEMKTADTLRAAHATQRSKRRLGQPLTPLRCASMPMCLSVLLAMLLLLVILLPLLLMLLLLMQRKVRPLPLLLMRIHLLICTPIPMLIPMPMQTLLPIGQRSRLALLLLTSLHWGMLLRRCSRCTKQKHRKCDGALSFTSSSARRGLWHWQWGRAWTGWPRSWTERYTAGG